MKKPTCEEIIDEIKALYAEYMPSVWIEVAINSWQEFSEQDYSCEVIHVDENFQKHELRCVAGDGCLICNLDGSRICGRDLSESGKTLQEGLTRLLESSRHLLKQNIWIMEY